MMSDHGFLVSWNHTDRDLTLCRADHRGVPVIGLVVETHAEPVKALANLRADLRGMLANTGGEYDTIKAAERACKGPDLASDPVDEQLDSFFGSNIATAEQYAHVTGDTSGNAEQTGFLI